MVWAVVGQTRAVSLLERSLARQTVAHAYLLVGPRQVGKRMLALELAKALNCEGANPPCGECLSCRKIATGKHADVQTISLVSSNSGEKPQTEISIDQIREMQHLASLPPFEGRCKVFIIDGAELMSHEAANSLLKTLEEPVARVVFILLTVNERLLPATIVSRCQRLELPPLAIAEVEKALTTRWGIEGSKARLLAGLCHGSLGWALAAAQDESRLKQRSERLTRLVRVVAGDGEERFDYAQELSRLYSQNRELVGEILDLWLNWWRDLLLIKIGCPELVTSSDMLKVLTSHAQGYRLFEIRDFMARLQTASEQLKQNANSQLALEVLLFNIPGRRG